MEQTRREEATGNEATEAVYSQRDGNRNRVIMLWSGCMPTINIQAEVSVDVLVKADIDAPKPVKAMPWLLLLLGD